MQTLLDGLLVLLFAFLLYCWVGIVEYRQITLSPIEVAEPFPHPDCISSLFSDICVKLDGRFRINSQRGKLMMYGGWALLVLATVFSMFACYTLKCRLRASAARCGQHDSGDC